MEVRRRRGIRRRLFERSQAKNEKKKGEEAFREDRRRNRRGEATKRNDDGGVVLKEIRVLVRRKRGLLRTPSTLVRFVCGDERRRVSPGVSWEEYTVRYPSARYLGR